MAKLKIRDVIQDDASLFNSKSIGFRNQRIHTPFKLLDFSETPAITKIDNWKSDALNEIDFVETSRLIDENRFFNELNKPEANFLSNQYDTYKNLKPLENKFFINSLTLQFNPMKIDGSKEYIKQFMNLYHGKSDFLLVPNLKVIKYENKKKVEQVSFEDYKKYVNISYDALSFRNSKPIFVPLSLKHGITKFEKLLREYIDFGYDYFWLDFEGSSSYSRTSYIRHFHSIIDDEYGITDNVVLYATNMRREMNPHVTDNVSVASDVLSSPLGIDILGVNRAPQGGGGGTRENTPSAEDLFNHKARFFDAENYGYVKYQNYDNMDSLFEKFNFDEVKIKSKPKFYSNFANTFKINSEFEVHREILEHDIPMLDYLGEKSFIPTSQLKNFMKGDRKKKTKYNRKKPNTRLNDFL